MKKLILLLALFGLSFSFLEDNVYVFDNIQQARQAFYVPAGFKVETRGYYAPGDGGGAMYEVQTDAQAPAPVDSGYVQPHGAGKKLVQIVNDNYLRAATYGVVCGAVDSARSNFHKLNRMFASASTYNFNVEFPGCADTIYVQMVNDTFMINNASRVSRMNITGVSQDATILKAHNSSNYQWFKAEVDWKVNFTDLTIIGFDASNHGFIGGKNQRLRYFNDSLAIDGGDTVSLADLKCCDSTRLQQDTILVHYDGGIIIKRDTIRIPVPIIPDDQTLSWNGATGELSISDGNTVDLDGRYLESFTETDPIWIADSSNYATKGYVDANSSVPSGNDGNIQFKRADTLAGTDSLNYHYSSGKIDFPSFTSNGFNPLLPSNVYSLWNPSGDSELRVYRTNPNSQYLAIKFQTITSGPSNPINIQSGNGNGASMEIHNSGYISARTTEGNSFVISSKSGASNLVHYWQGGIGLYSDGPNRKLGINTSSPTATLDVNGDAIFNSGGGDYDFTVKDALSNDLLFADAGLSRVGIGTSLPVAPLDIHGRVSQTYGGNSTAFGFGALQNDDGTDNNNVALGYYALSNNTSGSGNIGIGRGSLQVNTTGSNNISLGLYAMANNTGSANIGLGIYALQNNDGNRNIGLGNYTGRFLTTGSDNILIGEFVGYDLTTGSDNILIGNGAFANLTTQSQQTGIGVDAAASVNSGSGQDVYIGASAGRFITNSSFNTIIGGSAARWVGNNTGNNFEQSSTGVYIGYRATSGADSVTNEIVIGYNAVGNGSNTTTIGNSSTADTYLKGHLHVGDSLINTHVIPTGSDTFALKSDLTAGKFAAGNSGAIQFNRADTLAGTDSLNWDYVNGQIQINALDNYAGDNNNFEGLLLNRNGEIRFEEGISTRIASVRLLGNNGDGKLELYRDGVKTIQLGALGGALNNSYMTMGLTLGSTNQYSGALRVDGKSLFTDSISIGTNAPKRTSTIELKGDISIESINTSADASAIYIGDDYDNAGAERTFLIPGAVGNKQVFSVKANNYIPSGGVEIRLDDLSANKNIEINYYSEDVDFIVNDAVGNDLIFADAGFSRVGINQGAPQYPLHVTAPASTMGIYSEGIISSNSWVGSGSWVLRGSTGLYKASWTDGKIDQRTSDYGDAAVWRYHSGTSNTFPNHHIGGGHEFLLHDTVQVAIYPDTFRVEKGVSIFDSTVYINDPDHFNTGVLHLNNGKVSAVSNFRHSGALTVMGGSLQLGSELRHDGDNDTKLAFDSDRIRLYAGDLTMLQITRQNPLQLVEVNSDGGDVDFQIEDNLGNLIFKTDAGLSRVGINTASPQATLDVNGLIYQSGIGTYNTAFGFEALRTQNGTFNTAIGYQALENTSGSFNMAMGYRALQNNTGSNNVAIGVSALISNTSGAGNVAIGRSASTNQLSTRHGNIAIGSYALSNNQHEYNIGIGYASGAYLTNRYNVAIGRYAMRLDTSGREMGNISNSVFIGSETTAVDSFGTNQIAIGYQAIAEGTNTVKIGNDDITDTYLKGNINIPDKLQHTDDEDTYLNFGTNLFEMYAGGVEAFQFSGSEITFNPNQNDLNFRVKDDFSNPIIFADAGLSRVGINTSSPQYTLDVNGTINAVEFVGDSIVSTGLKTYPGRNQIAIGNVAEAEAALIADSEYSAAIGGAVQFRPSPGDYFTISDLPQAYQIREGTFIGINGREWNLGIADNSRFQTGIKIVDPNNSYAGQVIMKADDIETTIFDKDSVLFTQPIDGVTSINRNEMEAASDTVALKRDLTQYIKDKDLYFKYIPDNIGSNSNDRYAGTGFQITGAHTYAGKSNAIKIKVTGSGAQPQQFYSPNNAFPDYSNNRTYTVTGEVYIPSGQSLGGFRWVPTGDTIFTKDQWVSFSFTRNLGTPTLRQFRLYETGGVTSSFEAEGDSIYIRNVNYYVHKNTVINDSLGISEQNNFVPETLLDVDGYMTAQRIYGGNSISNNTYLKLDQNDKIVLFANGRNLAQFIDTDVIMNAGSGDVDFTVKDAYSNDLLVADAGLSRVGINTSSPDYALDVNGDIQADGTLRTTGTIRMSGNDPLIYGYQNRNSIDLYSPNGGITVNCWADFKLEGPLDMRGNTISNIGGTLRVTNGGSFGTSQAGAFYQPYNGVDGSSIIQTRTDNSIVSALKIATGSGNHRMIIDRNGLVSIGWGQCPNLSNCGWYTDTDAQSAILSLHSDSLGFLPPRMTNAQRDAITSPAEALFLYSTSDSSYYGRRTQGWEKIAFVSDIDAAKDSSWVYVTADTINLTEGSKVYSDGSKLVESTTNGIAPLTNTHGNIRTNTTNGGGTTRTDVYILSNGNGVDLSSADATAGRNIWIRNTSAVSDITITTEGLETINGNATYTVGSATATLFVSDGKDWYTF